MLDKIPYGSGPGGKLFTVPDLGFKDIISTWRPRQNFAGCKRGIQSSALSKRLYTLHPHSNDGNKYRVPKSSPNSGRKMPKTK
jgi:hypothetical protein